MKQGEKNWTPTLQRVSERIREGFLSFEKKIVIDEDISIEELQQAWGKVSKDGHDLFYVDFGHIEMTKSAKGVIIPAKYRYPEALCRQKAKQLQDLRFAVWQDFPGGTDAEKTEFIHDYLAEHVRYDYAAARNTSVPGPAYTIEGPLLDGMGVCSGIARSASFLLSGTGVESLVISGMAAEESSELSAGNPGHAWNLNLLKSGNYHMDITWDLGELSPLQTVLHQYCNIDDETIAQNHDWDYLSYPAARGLEDNYYIRRNLYFRTRTALQKYARKCFAERKKVFSFRLDPCAGFPDDGGARVAGELAAFASSASGRKVSLRYTFHSTILVMTVLAEYS